MADWVIRATGLSKRYHIGARQVGYRNLRETIMDAARAPLRRLRSVLSGRASRSSHEEIWALKDVSFEVTKGEVLGIIGRNGSGKSTLLKILSRITEPTEGRAEVRGRLGSLLEVGTGFHPELTGRDNIFLNGAILGMKRLEIQQKFDEIVAFAEVEKFIDTPVKHYSSGMYVRLAFAVAAHLDTELLILDEVLAVGDAAFQEKCLGKMGDVRRDGRAVLFVSHSMDAVSSLCTKALVIQDGRSVFLGDVQGAIDVYRGPVLKDLRTLEHCTHKGGEGGATITDVWTSDQAGVKGAPVDAGTTLRIDVAFDVTPEYRNKSLILGIGVDSAQGKRLFTAISSWDGTAIEVNKDSCMAGCLIEDLPLVPGTYLISAAVLCQATVLFSATHCASFEVRGKLPLNPPRERDHGDISIPCKFIIETRG